MRLLPQLSRSSLVFPEIARQILKLFYQSSPKQFRSVVVTTLLLPFSTPLLLLDAQYILHLVIGQGNRSQHLLEIFVSGAGIILILLVSRSLTIVKETSSSILREDLSLVISKKIMERFSHIPYEKFEENDFQANYGLVVGEASFRTTTLVDSFFAAGLTLTSLLTLSVTLLILAPILVLVVFLAIIPAAFVEQRYSNALLTLQQKAAPAKLRMQLLSSSQINGYWQRDLRVYQSDVVTHEHFRLSKEYHSNMKELVKIFQKKRILAVSSELIGVIIVLLTIYFLLSMGTLNLAILTILIPGLFMCLGFLRSFIGNCQILFESFQYAKKLLGFLDIHKNTGLALKEPFYPMRANVSSIKLNNITYSYPATGKKVINNMNYDFNVGLTAIVGKNGAGKSTLVKLLSSLIKPNEGKISIVSTEGEEQDLDSCVKSVLFQEPTHFYLSIRHNITMQSEVEANEDKKIINVLQQTGLWNLVKQLPDGLDTIVGPGFGGFTDLSGGQWQRLALARMLYHDSPLIIIDEPSASLDPVGEREIFEVLKTLAKDKIIIFTTHRCDTLCDVENILVLSDGEIIEKGSFEDLTQSAPYFQALMLTSRLE